jgi:phthiocerol/phenolphthiocerol synthesis type-I polyketide synthase E
MPDLDKRVAELTPQKREILARMLKRQERPPASTPSPPLAPAAETDKLVLDTMSPREPSALKASYKRFYDTVSAQLAESVYGQFSFFLNYGYVSDGQPEFAAIALPAQYINRNSVKLVLELIGDCRIDGKRVLDVGCGRGGTVHVLTTFFKPAQVTGLDLSTKAIEFCRQAHKDPRVAFHEGDAEHLPFADAAFDVVTNVESSHSYPHIHHFYSEVQRVLAPNGYFLYTDALSGQQVTSAIAYLEHIGLTLERDRDITKNVLLSCNEIAATRVQAFDSRNDQELMQNFLATPGSQVYEEMRSGNWAYRILTFRKRF